jgi:hypothetical protein
VDWTAAGADDAADVVAAEFAAADAVAGAARFVAEYAAIAGDSDGLVRHCLLQFDNDADRALCV